MKIDGSQGQGRDTRFCLASIYTMHNYHEKLSYKVSREATSKRSRNICKRASPLADVAVVPVTFPAEALGHQRL